MTALSIFAPAKLNLFLAVTGRRADGYHDLVSVVAPLDFGDTLRVEPAGGLSLECDDPEVPRGEDNLVLKAAEVFAQAAAGAGRGNTGARLMLEKRIPAGAGLGGGSSDAVAALRALNRLADNVLGPDAMLEAAARLGSDCPLFLHDGPVVMRGRGERVAALPPAAAARLRGRRVLIFKPGFSVGTPWAYERLAVLAQAQAGGEREDLGRSSNGAVYLPEAAAEVRLARWFDKPAAPIGELLFNSLELPTFAKFPALPVLLDELRARFGLSAGMSGSGSACFAAIGADAPEAEIVAAVRRAWGDSAFITAARLA